MMIEAMRISLLEHEERVRATREADDAAEAAAIAASTASVQEASSEVPLEVTEEDNIVDIIAPAPACTLPTPPTT